jgi:hypothetical protein
MKEESKIMASLDRIEDGLAVLILHSGHMWLLPCEDLPEGSGEGEVLDIIIRRNPEETEKITERIHDLQQRLLNRTETVGQDQDTDK